MKRFVAVGAALAAACAAAFTLPAHADDSGPGPVPTEIATGLNNPRHLSFAPNGDLYIAEAGAPTGDTSNCFTHPVFQSQVCLSDTGSITQLTRKGAQSRIVTGLPALENGEEMTGPSDVLLHGSTLTVAIGMGGTADQRAELGEAGRFLGTVTDVKLTGHRQTSTIRTDVTAFEDSDPNGDGVDSNPVDLARDGRGLRVVDAGGNTVLTVGMKGDLDVLATLKPLASGQQSVPTAAAQGPDGDWYVSELVGFPFQAGASTIWRIDKRGELHPYATGLSNVTDLAWHGKQLYAVQVSDDSVPAFFDYSGSLVAVNPNGAHTTVADDLFAPYGIAIRDGAAYVTTGSVAAGGGKVIRVTL